MENDIITMRTLMRQALQKKQLQVQVMRNTVGTDRRHCVAVDVPHVHCEMDRTLYNSRFSDIFPVDPPLRTASKPCHKNRIC